MSDNVQYGRKAQLVLSNGADGLDLSDFRFTFRIAAMDEESPNNAAIRVYNLSQETVLAVQRQYDTVTVDAGYTSNYGTIFKGNIRQWRVGRENTTDTYLDILAADGDEAYGWATVNRTVDKTKTSRTEQLNQLMEESKKLGVDKGKFTFIETGGILPRGKVLFGMWRALVRQQANTVDSTWSIQNGQVNVIPLDGYLPSGEILELNSVTGLIGRAETTTGGINAKCLLNPRITPGTLVRLDNSKINDTLAGTPGGYLGAYNRWDNAPILQAQLSTDGTYRVYISEFEGDTRGQAWYNHLVLLSVDPVTLICKKYG